MDLPDTLPGKLYLLALNPEKGRPVGRADLGLLLRAAALTDLLQRGLLLDVPGTGGPSVDGRAPQELSPVLTELLGRISESKPRSWGWWIRLRDRPAGTARPARAVRDELAAAGWIRLEEHRLLGLFPSTRISERDPRVRKALLAIVSTTLRGRLSQVEQADAALVALAGAAQLRTVLTWRQRREYRERLAELTARSGPIPRALRAAIRERNTVSS
ncbi:hypothetical protein P3T36_005647 [Kitasatospora sp. MAP12-15]|uniref:GOLPH3/VPS74 family protein n=1 Tax=unclassified Kitasatospora TaxID=2633591 RepID=UPI0024739042|nr:GPP34 family phosphoprotein [Kitasatospora sp. MAP12-44]MDH6113841.1 hypothetical protein [Kitasatospora sp. MAP12-44]